MGSDNNYWGLPSPKWPNVCRYEVFLSFRGGDVRRGFVEFLYEGLADSGIYAFIDRDGIEMGEKIMPKILQVIKHTDICIPIFSKDFASSKSCLKEVEMMVESDRTIMPIFYNVTPEVVGKQKESYQQSFCGHDAGGVTSTTINNWKRALHSASRIRGWELEKFQNGEHELIKNLVSTVRQLLKKDELDVTEHLVGMGHHVQEMMNKLGVYYENGRVIQGQMLTGKRVVEISGLSGIGKSTLAKIVYNKIRHLFEGWSFLDDVHGKVGERRLLSLQEVLISDLQKKSYTPRSCREGTAYIKHKFGNLRVLIVLDDVSDFAQISSLAGDLSWFGPGSRILVISMRSNLVDKYIQAHETSNSSVDRREDVLVKKYKLEKMNNDHAFQLLCKCALGRKPLREEFSSLAWAISSAAQGLPLVIEHVGSSINGQPIGFWKDAVNILSRKPFNDKIKGILKKIYKALEEDAREIFLDIACFFTGKDKITPSYMWEACEYNPSTRIAEIHNLSLAKVTENNEFWMHNQVKFLGMEIVKQKKSRKPSKRTRLWNQEDIERVLNEDKVATVEALSATFDDPPSFAKLRFFHNFSNLRFLRVSHAIFDRNEQTRENSIEDRFLPRLKWLEWQWCHDISSLLAFDLSYLVVLDLSWSISTTWRCWRQIMQKAKNLKVLILRHCSWLAQPLVCDAPVNLEILNLEHCSTLPGIGRSISNLKNLVSLNIKFCSFVEEFPEEIGYLVDLKELYIDGTDIGAINFPEGSYGKLEILSANKCKISSLPDSIGNLKSLCCLALDDTGLSELPASIGLLKNLHKLSLRNCVIFRKLPDSIGKLKELQEMDLSYTSVKELPSSVQDLGNLKVLKMARTFIKEFPGCIKNLGSLEEIDFSGCGSLEGKCDIMGLSSLRVLLLQDTDISLLIGMDFQFSALRNLRKDAHVHIRKVKITKEA